MHFLSENYNNIKLEFSVSHNGYREYNMLRGMVRLKTSSTAWMSRVYFNQSRLLTVNANNAGPDIAKIYAQLMDHSVDAPPIPCNFISQVVDHWAKQPDRLAIHCVDQDGNEHADITYAEMVDRSHQIASFLTMQGFKPGDSVALMLGQRPAWWFALAGLMRAGIAAVPCSRLLTPKDLLYRINDLGMRGFITTPELQDRIDVIRAQCPTLTTTLTTGPSSKDWFSTREIFNHAEISRIRVATTTAHPCLYLYTSGTTGQPKAVQHNADYPFFHWPTGLRWLCAGPDDLIYNASDPGWGFTGWITLAAWAMGSKLLIAPTNKKFDAEKMLHTLRDQKVTIFAAAPTVLRLLVAHPNFANIAFPSLKRIVTVGEALDEVVIKCFEKRGIKLCVGFGQAETPLIIACLDDQPHIPNTMGSPVDPYKIVILDENFCPLPPGSMGQIAVDLVAGKRGGIMRGYANAPEKTKAAFSPDGDFLTGDYAVWDLKGYLKYCGRRDDIIKSSGYRIGPDEVEKAGMSHPAVAKIAVVGIRTDVDSAAITIKAFVLLKPGYKESPALAEEIQNHIKQETAPYKYPRLVEFLSPDEWEKYETTSGKMKRAELRQREEDKLKAAHPQVSSPWMRP